MNIANTILGPQKHNTLKDLLAQFKRHKQPFYWEAPAEPGVSVILNWEDPEEVDCPSQIAQVFIDVRKAPRYPGPVVGDHTTLEDMGDWWRELDDEVGTALDGTFRTSINDSPVAPFMFTPEWSNNSTHVYATDVPIRREEPAVAVV